jgi:hypothetical protein
MQNKSIFSKGEVQETVGAVVDQRNLNTKTFIADMVAKLENYRQENVRKLS